MTFKNLGPKWRLMVDRVRNTCVFLHARGLWVEIDYLILCGLTVGERNAIVDALEQAVSDGLVGHHRFEATKHEDGSYSAVCVPCAPEMPCPAVEQGTDEP